MTNKREEPKNLKELIDYFELSYNRMEDEHDVICSFTDIDRFSELLKNLENDFKKLNHTKDRL